jgi:hypothetical protein
MPQNITITLEFKTKHNPGDKDHLQQVAHAYFKSKGIELSEELVIKV